MTEKHETVGLKVPTNKWAGDLIGYSESGASLLRRGLRQPSLALMRTVDEALDWSPEEQVTADGLQLWAREFEIRLAGAYTAELEGQA